MIDRLLERLDGPIVLVLGKGGVGKTTTAGGLALALADRGESVHLISTDPAHSLGDLFEQDLPSGLPRPSRCEPRLTLEEFDAAGAFTALRQRAAAPLRELLERGTYLDDEDIGDFLERSLPGIDEVLGALRLAALASGVAGGPADGAGDDGARAARLVVDTAPTGHTLRLLDAPAVLDGWVAALRAMERKALAVASALTREVARLSSAEFLDALEAEVDAFRALLRRAAAVLVWRPEPLVEEETRRLREAVRARGLRLVAEVRVEPETSAGPDGSRAPASAAPAGRTRGRPLLPTGCEGLRHWKRGVGWRVERADGATGQARAARATAAPSAPAARILPGGRRRLLFVGKGGVGKTTCAVACAAALSASRRVTLVSTDPAGSLGDLLGRVPGREGLWFGDRLLVRQLEADRAFQELRDEHRADVERIARGIGIDDALSLDRAVLDSLFDLVPPGLDELFGVALLLEEGEEDLLVLDTAPTGHLLRLLETPEVATGWIHSLMRLLLKYRELTGLGSAAERLVELGRRLRVLRTALTDPEQTGAVAVTIPEPLVEAETRRLCTGLAAAGVPVAAVLWNRTPEEGRYPAAALPECGLDAPRLAAPVQGAPVANLEGAAAFFTSWRVVT